MEVNICSISPGNRKDLLEKAVKGGGESMAVLAGMNMYFIDGDRNSELKSTLIQHVILIFHWRLHCELRIGSLEKMDMNPMKF
jgi:hypothetical protein